MASKAEEPTKERKGKWRLSSLLHSKDNDQQQVQPAPVAAPPDNPPAESSLAPTPADSAYGGSIRDSSSTGIPTISDSQAKAQDAELKTRKDENTGRTITTTTTTTTTTGTQP